MIFCNGSGCFILIYWEVLSCRLPLHLPDWGKVNKMGWRGHINLGFLCLEVVRMLWDSRQKWGDRGRGDGDTHGDREMHTGKRQSDKALSQAFRVHTLHLSICVHSRRRSDLRGQESCEHMGRRNYRDCERAPRSQGHYLIIQVLSITFQSWEQDFERAIAKENSHYLFYCTFPL